MGLLIVSRPTVIVSPTYTLIFRDKMKISYEEYHKSGNLRRRCRRKEASARGRGGSWLQSRWMFFSPWVVESFPSILLIVERWLYVAWLRIGFCGYEEDELTFSDTSVALRMMRAQFPRIDQVPFHLLLKINSTFSLVLKLESRSRLLCLINCLGFGAAIHITVAIVQ